MSPFEMDFGWNPISALKFIAGYESSIESDDYLKNNLREILNNPHYSYFIAKVKQSAMLSQNYKPLNYSMGWKLWIYKSI